MKFEINVGTDYSTVRFTADMFSATKFKPEVINSFKTFFERLGGQLQDDYSWTFPTFITSQVLEEVIHNTCFVCGGLMKDGQAIQNGEIRVPEEDVRGGYTPYIDTTNHSLIKVRKCTACGHSHT